MKRLRNQTVITYASISRDLERCQKMMKDQFGNAKPDTDKHNESSFSEKGGSPVEINKITTKKNSKHPNINRKKKMLYLWKNGSLWEQMISSKQQKLSEDGS